MIRRRSACLAPLRCLSLLMTVCFLWSFTGAGIAMAAAPQPKPVHSASWNSHPFVHAPHFSALASPFDAAHGLVSGNAASSVAVPTPDAPVALLSSPTPAVSETLWDDTGHLTASISGAQVTAWKQELKTTHPNNHRAAELHLWLGEVAIARDKQPNVGLWHFQEAKRLASSKDPMHYLAAYDTALGLFYDGAFQESEEALTSLMAVRHTAHGFNREYAALWLRHVSACVGYHAAHEALGIPEPSRLDPFCGIAALAARLQVMGRPSDKKTLLKACRVTGEGSNMQDLLDAAPRLGVHAEAVQADDQGLIALPKPVVAYVEHDHFIAVSNADRHGVSYLCSDCGPWPGGEVTLTWAQWHAMDAGLYTVVTEPGSAWDKTLAALKTQDSPHRPVASQPALPQPVRVASNRLSGVLPRQVEGLVRGWPLLRGHVVMDYPPVAGASCGAQAVVFMCTLDSNPPWDDPLANFMDTSLGNPNNSSIMQSLIATDGNPQEGDPVNLATGQEEYSPNPDLIVYNPTGPSITWRRTYQTLRGPGTTQMDDFGAGWSQPYNVSVIVSGAIGTSGTTGTILFANGGKLTYTFSGSPTSGHPVLGTPPRSGIPLLLQWDYDSTPSGHFEIIYKDRSHWITASSTASNPTLVLGQITDRNGNSIYFNYPTVSNSLAISGWPLLGSITTGPNATGTTLLSIQRNTTVSNGYVDGNILSVTDHPGTSSARSVCYQAAHFSNQGTFAYYVELTHVSQIVPTVTASAPDRFAYGYKLIPTGEIGAASNILHTTTTPSPSGSGTSTAYIWCMNDNTADSNGKTNPNYISGAPPYISALVDPNGNRRLYSSSDGVGDSSGIGVCYSKVAVQNSSGTPLYSYQVSYDSNLNETVRTDGNGHVISQMSYASAGSPYAPTTVQDGNAPNTSLLPVARPGAQLTMPDGGTTGPASTSNTWQVLNASGTTVATSSVPNGWTFSITYGSVATMVITSPSSAAVGQYEVLSSPASGQPNPGARPVTPAAGVAIIGNFSAYFLLRIPVSSPVGVTTYTYDQYGNVLTKTTPRGTTTTYTYTYSNFAMGELTQVQEGTNLSPSKAPTVYVYDDTDGYLDANGLSHPCGLLSSVTAPLPGTTNSTQTAVTSYTYDVTGKGTMSLGQLGLGNPLTVTRPGNNAAGSITTTMNYTTDGGYSQSAAIGQPVTVTDNLSEVTHLRYDSQGNTTGVKDALGNETDQAYTIGNNPLQTVLPVTGQTGSGHAGSTSSYLYSEPSSFATTAWPLATLQYGALSATTQYDEGNVGAIRQVVNTYGPEGETLSVTGSTEPVSYTYDALYRISTLKDAALNTTSYFYNAAGYLAQTVYPGASSTPPTSPLTAGHADTMSFPSYDGVGNPLTRVDGRNQTTTYTYNDPESLLTKITYPSGTLTNVTQGYDAYGRRNAISDSTGSQTYAYDDDDFLTQKVVTWTGLTAKTVAYAFYPNGSRKTLTADGHLFTSTYDGIGRVTGLANDNSETTSYGYQANSWLSTKTLANGIATTNTLDAQGRSTDLVNKLGTTTLSDFRVPVTSGYDGVGNRLSVTATVNGGAPVSYSGTTTYAYDYGQSSNPQLNRSQLTQETSTRSGSYTNVYGYDGSTSGGPGNPTSFKGATNTFNADNQVTNTGYGYDGNGNPTTYHTAALTFDPENRMTTDGSLQTDGYGGDNLRVWKQAGINTSTRTYFLYDGTLPVVEYSSTGTATASNTFSVNGLVSRHVSAGTTFYTFDERGNIVQRTSSTGAVTGSELYDSYGSRVGTAAQPDPFGYEGQAGYYTDLETGLILCTHRFYDPSNGRWLTRDPIGYGGGVNLYGYTGNDPSNRVDPSGLIPIIRPIQVARPPGIPVSWPDVPPGLPGGPYYKWVPNPPNSNKGPGNLQGTGRPGPGGRPILVYKPIGKDNPEPYWKCKDQGQKGWDRYDLNGNFRPPEVAHPGNPPSSGGEGGGYGEGGGGVSGGEEGGHHGGPVEDPI